MYINGLLSFLGDRQYLLVYFYPQDDTPGCTLEAKDFSALYEYFLKHGVAIVGVSKDSDESHTCFIDKYGLSIPLVSDPDLLLHKQFGVWGEKNLYGKITQGVIRSTFLLDDSGNIIKEWRNVRAKGHAQRVLKYVEEHL